MRNFRKVLKKILKEFFGASVDLSAPLIFFKKKFGIENIDDYKIGKGDSGIVYKYNNYAIKFTPDKPINSLRVEGKSLKHVVNIHKIGKIKDTYFIVMEYVHTPKKLENILNRFLHEFVNKSKSIQTLSKHMESLGVDNSLDYVFEATYKKNEHALQVGLKCTSFPHIYKQLFNIAKELKSNGVYWEDVHEKQFGMKNNNIVAFDIEN